MNVSRTAIFAVALMSVLVRAPVAHADEGTNRAAAQALYDEAVKLMDIGSFPAACKKLEDADKLVSGIGTKARLGECYEKSDRLASAWSMYRGALSLAESKSDARVTELRGRVGALEPRLSRLRVDVPANARVDGLKVVRDGTELPEGLWGTSVPVDGGEHNVEATAPGKSSWKTSVTVGVEKAEGVVSVLPLPAAPGAAPLATTKTAPITTTPPPERAPRGTSSTQRTVGYVVGGVGVAALGVGGILGLVAKSKYAGSDEGCAATGCPKSSVDKADTARGVGNIATVVVIVGAAGLLTGGGLVLFSPPPKKSDSATLEGGIAGPTGVFVRGSFLHAQGSRSVLLDALGLQRNPGPGRAPSGHILDRRKQRYRGLGRYRGSEWKRGNERFERNCGTERNERKRWE